MPVHSMTLLLIQDPSYRYSMWTSYSFTSSGFVPDRLLSFMDEILPVWNYLLTNG